MKSIDKKDFMEIGTVSKTHGTKGEIKISTNCKIKFNKWAFLEIREKPVPFYIQLVSQTLPDEFILKLEGVDSLEQAQALLGLTALLPITKKKKHLNQSDILHYNLVDAKLGKLGKIERIDDLPNQKLLVVLYKNIEVLIPFVEDFIQSIDDETQTIYLNLPDGLIEIFE